MQHAPLKVVLTDKFPSDVLSARLHQDEEAIKILFNDIAPTQKERHGGYTRIIRLGGGLRLIGGVRLE